MEVSNLLDLKFDLLHAGAPYLRTYDADSGQAGMTSNPGAIKVQHYTYYAILQQVQYIVKK